MTQLVLGTPSRNGEVALIRDRYIGSRNAWAAALFFDRVISPLCEAGKSLGVLFVPNFPAERAAQVDCLRAFEFLPEDFGLTSHPYKYFRGQGPLSLGHLREQVEKVLESKLREQGFKPLAMARAALRFGDGFFVDKMAREYEDCFSALRDEKRVRRSAAETDELVSNIASKLARFLSKPAVIAATEAGTRSQLGAFLRQMRSGVLVELDECNCLVAYYEFMPRSCRLRRVCVQQSQLDGASFNSPSLVSSRTGSS